MTAIPPSGDLDGADRHDPGDGVHGVQPMTGVDPAPAHGLVDELATMLHTYVDTATGVRAEFGAAEADEDPRVLAVEGQIATLNARLYDLLHSSLGIHPELTGMTWRDPGDHAGAELDRRDTDEFHLGFLIGLPSGPTDQTGEAALGLIDNGGAELVRRLAEAGFAVREWGSSQGAPLGFDGDEEGQP